MGNIEVTRTYAKSEFNGTTPSGQPNLSIFTEEVADESLSVQPFSIYEAGTNIQLQWSSLPVAADITAIDALVTAHTGGAFSGSKQSAVAEAEDTNDTTTESVRVTLDAGKLPPGDYLVVWSCELCVTSVIASSGVQANFYVTKNGGSRSEQGQAGTDVNVYDTRAASAILTVLAGDSYKFELGYKRIGAANTAKMQRARIYLKPFDE